MKNINKILYLLLGAATMLAACQKTEDVFQRDTDKITLDCTAQVVTHYVLASGDWSIETEENWLSFDPAAGSGDGIKHQEYKVNVAYNSGDARTGVYYIVHNGTKAIVNVEQAACNFKYGAVKFSGSLNQNVESTANVLVAYSNAAGNESVSYSGTITGEGAEGLSIVPDSFDSFQAGSGSVIIPISGTPVNYGNIEISISLNGKEIGTTTANVAKEVIVTPPGEGGDTDGPEGLEVGWNLYAAGYSADLNPGGSDYDYSWSFGQNGNDKLSKNPVGSALPSTAHKVIPTSGNSQAYFTCVGAGLSAYTFNPSIQAKGLLEGDYWLAVIPVRNLNAGTRVCVEMACGGAGGSVGFYLLEYSADNSTWTTADGAKTCKRGDEEFPAHLWNTGSSIGASGYENTRKTYDKASDDTYQKYEFPLNLAISDGTLYFRLRVLKYRATVNSTSTVSAGWTDIKGFEVSLVR